MQLPNIHLCIVQPLGYVHALGFLDQARFFRHQFRRMGASVSLAKNRLRHDAVNFVFGAHVGFDPALQVRHTCVFVNLEQLGLGGASVSAAYLQLLGESAVVDYDAGNVAAYAACAGDVPLVSFGHAPYLRTGELPIEQRPIDLLFIGSLNERRARLIEAVEATGLRVSVPDGPIYGPERDDLICQARAVFNCHFYDSARFEQARAFQCLSLGTPVISERTAASQPPAQFENGVFWVGANELREFFSRQFLAPRFADEARERLSAFREHDVIEEYAEVLAFGVGYRSVQKTRMDVAPWRPTRLQIGSGRDYRPGWFNVDILEQAQPDAVLDLATVQTWPMALNSATAGAVELHAHSLDTIYANNVLEHVLDLSRLMTNCLDLLREGGRMIIEVPYERAPTAWQDPTHVRAMNSMSWVYYADWFWYLGWFDWRFQMQQLVYLDATLNECTQDAAHFMRVSLVKVATTPAERMTARTMQADFGFIGDDIVSDDYADEVAALQATPTLVDAPAV